MDKSEILTAKISKFYIRHINIRGAKPWEEVFISAADRAAFFAVELTGTNNLRLHILGYSCYLGCHNDATKPK